MASPAGSEHSTADVGTYTYARLIAEIRKRVSNINNACFLPDVTTLTFNKNPLKNTFPLQGATKQGLLVGKFDPDKDGNVEDVYAYAHEYVAHKGKKTQSISYFLFQRNRQVNEEELVNIDFDQPFDSAFEVTCALFVKRVRMLILFYFMEKGLVASFDPLTDDMKLFKAAIASVAHVATTLKQKPCREYASLRAPNISSAQRIAPFASTPRPLPFEKHKKDDEPEFVAAVEKAPSNQVSFVPRSQNPAANGNTEGVERSRPVDLTETNKPTTRSGQEPAPRKTSTSTNVQMRPGQTDAASGSSAIADHFGDKRGRQATGDEDETGRECESLLQNTMIRDRRLTIFAKQNVHTSMKE